MVVASVRLGVGQASKSLLFVTAARTATPPSSACNKECCRNHESILLNLHVTD